MKPTHNILILIFIMMMTPSALYAQTDPCAGLLTPRLQIGSLGRVTPGGANNVRTNASVSAKLVFRMSAGTQFQVLAGPVCDGDYTWWQVESNAQRGWTVEATASDYFLEPVVVAGTNTSPTVTPMAVADCMPANLLIDNTARVLGNTPLKLRDAAGLGSNQIGQIQPLDVIRVVEGPQCLDGIQWWKVEISGQRGWVAEGLGGEYFLELVMLTPTPTPAFESLPQSFDLDWNSEGNRIAVGTVDGIFLFDPQAPLEAPTQILAGQRINRVAFHPQEVSWLAFSQSADMQQTVQLLDLESGEILKSYSDVSYGVTKELMFTAEGTQLMALIGGELVVFDVETGDIVYAVTPPNYSDIEFQGFSVAAISPDGSRVGGGYPSSDNSFVFAGHFGDGIYELLVIESVTIPDQITTYRFSPQGDRFVMGDASGNMRMWTLDDLDYSSAIRGAGNSTSNYINRMAFSPDGSLIATAERDPLATVRFFDGWNLARVGAAVLRNDATSASDLAFSPDSSRLAVLVEGTVVLLNVESKEIEATLVLRNN